jgi:hypothetical protein
MRCILASLALAALLGSALPASAQVLAFSDEGQFLSAVDDLTRVDFEEVADEDAISITAADGTFTRESINFRAADNRGNPAFGQVIGRDNFAANGLPPYNLGSGDFLFVVSEFPVTLEADLSAVDSVGVGFRLDDRIRNGALSVVVRTDLNGTIETFDFSVDTAASNETFFGVVGADGRHILDITVLGDVGNPVSQLSFDALVSARTLAAPVPAPASLPVLGLGFAAIGIALRRRRA